MSIVEIRCPSCGSSSLTRKGKDYQCNNCETFFQVVPSKKVVENKAVSKLKFGKVKYDIEQVKLIGNFYLDLSSISIEYLPIQLFKYYAYKKLIRGSTTIEANEFGYVFINPFNCAIFTFINKENVFPEYTDCNGIYREALMIHNVDALDDQPFKDVVSNAEPLDLDQLQKKALGWVIENLVIEKRYIQPSAYTRKTRDLGLRWVKIKFTKKDFKQFEPIVAFWVPIIHLSYKHPNSDKSYKRAVMGFSGEIISDEIKCYKTKNFGKPCDAFPINICASCKKLVCLDHEKQCEKCGIFVCEECIVSKGLMSKHYYCAQCF